MQLVTPGIGLIFWMLVSFSLVLYILAKFAWGPIMKGIHQREDTIEKALEAANEAKKEMLQLKAGNEQLLREVWGPTAEHQTHYLRVYMARLREKLEVRPSEPLWLRTEPGIGYRLTESPGE